MPETVIFSYIGWNGIIVFHVDGISTYSYYEIIITTLLCAK